MQPSQYAINFAGPFLGLNTVQAPHMLAPGFATVAENVLITRGGGVRPRDPWHVYWRDYFAAKPWSIFVGMLHIDTSKLAGFTGSGRSLRVLVKQTDPEALSNSLYWHRASPLEGGAHYGQLAHPVGGSTPLAPTWVLANRRLYVIDGSAVLAQYDGEKMFSVGILSPTVEQLSDDTYPDSPLEKMVYVARWTNETEGPEAGGYDYGFTVYDSVHGIESNMSSGWSFQHTGSTRVKVLIVPGNIQAIGEQNADHVRIYRRHTSDAVGDALGSPYRLIGEHKIDLADPEWDEDVPDADVTAAGISDVATGPFGPTRNGLPPAARIAVWYKNRMWYADPDDGTRLWFSEFAFPEHVGSTSFILIGGDSDDIITGMVEMAGQIIILKKDSIWILSGDLDTYDNRSVALALQPGVDFAESFPEVYKTKSKTGCHNSGGGNGAIVCGHPPLLYYSNANGLYRFDGVDDRLVSDLVMDEWAGMMNVEGAVDETDHTISYAVDLANDVLYVCRGFPFQQATPFNMTFARHFLAYHWGVNRGDGVGVWTTIKGKEEPDPSNPEQIPQGIACIATALGVPSELYESDGPAGEERVRGVSSLLVAPVARKERLSGEVIWYTGLLYADSVPHDDAVIPLWLWRTGDLLLAGGKKAHLYYLEYRHERAKGGPAGDPGGLGAGPTVKVQYAVDDGSLELLSPSEAGQDTKGLFMRRLRLGRTGRSLALEFSRGDVTEWEPWNGLTGFAVDVELAEQR